MKNLNKSALRLTVLFTALLFFAGCDIAPNAVYEIKTTDGTVIKIKCPVVDRDRSKMTYFIDAECVAIK